MPNKNTTPGKIVLKKWRIYTFSDEQKLREFCSTKPALQKKMLMEYKNWNWKMLNNKLKTNKSIKFTSKDKYIKNIQ